MEISYIEKAFEDNHLRLEKTGKTERLIYVATNRSERWSDPEEKVRAAFYAELIYRYGYLPNRIGVEITVPDRSPNDYADLVVFEDDQRKRPFAVIECKSESISDAEFNQAVEQAWGNGNAAKFRTDYIGVEWLPVAPGVSSTATIGNLALLNVTKTSSPTSS